MLVRSRAPLRLSFAGGGTELSPYVDQHGGMVINATIGRYAYATLFENSDGKIHLQATDQNIAVDLDATAHLDIDGPLKLHRGVYNRMVHDFNDGKPLPVSIVTYCDAPIGSGLGASSTVTVAIIKAFAEYLSLSLDEYALARLAFEIERIDLGLNGGRQDQYAATFGGFNFMEFLTGDRVIVNPLRIKSWIQSELEASLVLYYTGTSRESAHIIQEQTRRLEAADENIVRRFDSLKAQALSMKEALLRGDMVEFATLLGKSWAEKRATAPTISNASIDAAYDAAIAAGALGGKISGAGGGGFMMLICDPCSRSRVVHTLEQLGGAVMNCHFVDTGVEAWSVPKSKSGKPDRRSLIPSKARA